MLKKIGISLLLAGMLLLLGLNVQTGTTLQVEATACRTLAECRDRERETRANIAGIVEERGDLNDNLAILQESIAVGQAEIAESQNNIRELVEQITSLEVEIAELEELIEKTIVIIDETTERIDLLMDLISRRMRATQRFNNTNSTLANLSGAESLNDFIRIVRDVQRAATSDAAIMEELVELIEANRERYAILNASRERVEAQRLQLEEHREVLEENQRILEEAQQELLENEQQLQDELQALYEQQRSEESRLAQIAAAEEMLRRQPPVQVQPPAGSSGLAHPMPGSYVSSPFGPRRGRHHAGVDLIVRGNNRAPILASAAGTVTLAGWHNSMGNWIIISHNINGSRVDTVYAHLSSMSVSAGATVVAGQQIGVKGNTGFSFGDHLHFEVHPGGFNWGNAVNPAGWINF